MLKCSTPYHERALILWIHPIRFPLQASYAIKDNYVPTVFGDRDGVVAQTLFANYRADPSVSGRVNEAWCYFYGVGMKQDQEKARVMYEEFKNDSPVAHNNWIACKLLQKTRSPEWARDQWRQILSTCPAARRNACYILDDWKLELDWIKTIDYAPCNRMLGIYYLDRGDPQRAMQCVRRSADQGYIPAFGAVGHCYDALGDKEAAIPWFKRGADEHDPYAVYCMYWMGKVKRLNMPIAEQLEYLNLAVAFNQEDAWLELARAHELGQLGLAVNLEKAKELYLKVAHEQVDDGSILGFQEACDALARLYHCQGNLKEAERFAQQGADRGHGTCMLRLGVLQRSDYWTDRYISLYLQVSEPDSFSIEISSANDYELYTTCIMLLAPHHRLSCVNLVSSLPDCNMLYLLMALAMCRSKTPLYSLSLDFGDLKREQSSLEWIKHTFMQRSNTAFGYSPSFATSSERNILRPIFTVPMFQALKVCKIESIRQIRNLARVLPTTIERLILLDLVMPLPADDVALEQYIYRASHSLCSVSLCCLRHTKQPQYMQRTINALVNLKTLSVLNLGCQSTTSTIHSVKSGISKRHTMISHNVSKRESDIRPRKVRPSELVHIKLAVDDWEDDGRETSNYAISFISMIVQKHPSLRIFNGRELMLCKASVELLVKHCPLLEAFEIFHICADSFSLLIHQPCSIIYLACLSIARSGRLAKELSTLEDEEPAHLLVHKLATATNHHLSAVRLGYCEPFKTFDPFLDLWLQNKHLSRLRFSSIFSTTSVSADIYTRMTELVMQFPHVTEFYFLPFDCYADTEPNARNLARPNAIRFQRFRLNWMRLCTCIAFYRANYNHPFVSCILPIVKRMWLENSKYY